MNRTGPKPRSVYQRLWAKVDRLHPNGCWVWTGTVNGGGYGTIGVGSRSDGTKKKVLAHRVAFEWFKGEIPEGHDVCHTCDNPRCVNPDHLFIGTRAENMQDCSRKGRARKPTATHCKNGHPFSDENTIHTGTQRACRICRRAATRRHYYRNKELSP